MAHEYPLLIFPEPQTLNRIGTRIFPGQIHYPSHARQSERLSPLFQTLKGVFDARRVEIQQMPEGVNPDQVIVFETIGSVDDFVIAVRNTPGLEWLGEIEIDNIEPTEDFYDVKNMEKTLSGRLFLTMSNNRAMEELLSLWTQYSRNPQMQFRRGFSGFKSLFSKLRDVRKWDIQDRLIETGIIDYWLQDLERGEETIRFELQLWFSNSAQKRERIHNNILSILAELGGRCINSSLISEISYHALLIELPANEIRRIINHESTRLVKYDDIMFFRPTGQICIEEAVDDEAKIVHENIKEDYPNGNPIAAIFDGMPMENHSLLSRRLIIDDPDNFANNYQVNCREHGTGMCSLIIHGDLNDNTQPISTPLYVRPIMKLKQWIHRPIERVPDDCLFVDLIHRAVKRIFEGGEGVSPYKSIKVINFSIGDSNQLFYHSISPLARLLDWLSVKYNVIFIISTGNHIGRLELQELYRDFIALDNEDKEKLIYRKIFNDCRNRKLLSPSESINNITVGGIHIDSSNIRAYDRRHNPTQKLLPAVYSAFGGGYRNSIKPDLVYSGGRMLYKESYLDNIPTPLEISSNYAEPGHCVAAPSDQTNKTYYTRGTSNATALITRAAVSIAEVLKEIFQENYDSPQYNKYVSSLIKVMLVHGCSWNDIADNINQIFHGEYSNTDIKKITTKWIGYGVPDIDKVIHCTAQRVTILGFGEIQMDKVHLYKLPLPPSLASRPENRKLTITLAWLSPIAATTQRYRVASLYFEAQNDLLGVNREGADWRKVRQGTLQHEVFVGDNATPFDNDSNIEIRVVCKKDAQDFNGNIIYALAVTLEVAEDVDIPIYQDVKNRLAVPVVIEQQIV